MKINDKTSVKFLTGLAAVNTVIGASSICALAAGSTAGSWSLVNFSIMCVVILEAIMLAVGYFVKPKNQEDVAEEANKKTKSNGIFRLLSIPVAVVSAVVFFMTEDISLNTGMIDNMTIWMAVILIVQTVFVILSRKKIVDAEEEENKEEGTPAASAQ